MTAEQLTPAEREQVQEAWLRRHVGQLQRQRFTLMRQLVWLLWLQLHRRSRLAHQRLITSSELAARVAKVEAWNVRAKRQLDRAVKAELVRLGVA